MELLLHRFEKHQAMMTALKADTSLQKKFQAVCESTLSTLKNGGTVFFCGNGGSASDAEHAAAELVGRFKKERKPLSAEAFSANTSTLTAIGNDYGYDNIFARQVLAKCKKEDLIFLISTSGSSKNVIAAMKEANQIGTTTVALIGANGDSPLGRESKHCLSVPALETAYIQECHIFLIHSLCDYIDNYY